MKKILTLTAIAIIFASTFANASVLTTGNGGNANFRTTVKTSKTTKIHYIKISAKEFSVKAMQDTKDILMQPTPVDNVANFFTAKAA